MTMFDLNQMSRWDNVLEALSHHYEDHEPAEIAEVQEAPAVEAAAPSRELEDA
ncbi:hypothetical protein [Rhodovulum kholense]|uniref:Uncharacterized protein n=1 Tax=Rhodovulum kholense TaxID=453584 RepID=A0A8E2VHN4_9RHOB|nr:hypothetical protein [Rhodovulum kholense]PTW44821.1 hypothetical protein C8N38_11514 [Rhodovulum kholense]